MRRRSPVEVATYGLAAHSPGATFAISPDMGWAFAGQFSGGFWEENSAKQDRS